MTEAVAAYVREFVRERLRAIESENGTPRGAQAQLARELDMTPANVSHWSAGKPRSASRELEQLVADIRFEGSVDALRSAAAAMAKDAPSADLPLEYVRALGQLDVRHGRDFTAAARSLFASQPAFHGAPEMTIELLSRQIEEEDARLKGKSAVVGREAVDDVPLGRAALRGKKR